VDAETKAEFRVVQEQMGAFKESMSRLADSLAKRDVILFGEDGRKGLVQAVTILEDAQKRRANREAFLWLPLIVGVALIALGALITSVG